MILNPFLEFELIDLNTKKIICYDYLNKKKFMINARTLYDIISNNSTNKEKYLKNGIFIDETNTQVKFFLKLKEKWGNYNWSEAFKYHLSTIDYKFQENLEIANQKMREYGNKEIDNLREKKTSYDKFYKLSFENNINPSVEKNKNLTKEKLLLMLAYTFCFVKKGTPTWKGSEVLFRTTPSGGARQPTEGYLYVVDVEGLENGWYYINGKDFKIEKLSGVATKKESLKSKFSLIGGNLNFNIKAIVILTSVFEKNMYRYREARTFRSIHMDVGHLLGLMEEFSKRYNFLSFVQYGLEEDYIEKELGINYLEEGYQSSILFGE